MTKRLAVCNPTVTQTKQLKARSPFIETLLCVLQTAKETLNKYCKFRTVWNDTNNSKIYMYDEIQDRLYSENASYSSVHYVCLYVCYLKTERL